jgi:hypothetical protein
MNRHRFEHSIIKLRIIKELSRRELLEEPVAYKLQENIATDILSADEFSLEEVMEMLQKKESDKNLSIQDAQIFTVFISYAHKDNDDSDQNKRWLDRLLEHLEPLVLQNQICKWSDKELEIGDSWHEQIQSNLQSAKVAVILVSPAFLASKYIRNSELPILLKNAKDNGTVILPIILRHCLFEETKFKFPDPNIGPDSFSLSSLQSANSPNKPLNGLEEHEQDQVLLKVAQRILGIVQHQVP